MTRNEALDLLGISKNAPGAMIRAAFKAKYKEAETEVERQLYGEAYHVLTGTRPAEEEEPSPKPKAKTPPPTAAPGTPSRMDSTSRDVKAKSRDIADPTKSTPKAHADKNFRRDEPLPDSDFKSLPEMSASRSYQSYNARKLGLFEYSTGPSGENWDITIAPDERTFILASASGVYKWDIRSGKIIKKLEAHSYSDTYGCDISADGRYALTANCTGEVFLWDYENGTVLKRLELHGEPRKVRFVLGDQKAIRIGWDGYIALWDLNTGQHDLLTDKGSYVGSGTSGLAISANGKRAFTVCPKTSITAWDLESKERLWTTEAHGEGSSFADLAVSQDETLAVVSYPVALVWFDLRKRRIVQAYPRSEYSHFHPRSGAAISHDGQTCLTSSHKDIILWRLPDRKPIKRLTGHAKSVETILFAKDDSYALSTSHDATVKLWRF